MTSEFLAAARDRGQAMLTSGIVTRHAVHDGLVDIRTLKSDPLWEQDFLTDNWVRRTPEFLVAHAKSEEALPSQREAAEVALHLALLELAGQLPQQEDGPRHAWVDGIGPYVEITSWDNPHATCPVHQTSGDAIKEWRSRLLSYVAQAAGDTIWWRERPEIYGRVVFGDTQPVWAIYSRLLIGNASDTLIERLRREELAPTRAMVEDNLVSADQLIKMDWSLNENGDWIKAGWAFDVSEGRLVKCP